MDFREYIRTDLLEKNNRILEFGPLTRATVTKDKYPNVKFADIRSTEDIKKLYSGNDYLKSTGITVDLDSIVDIDYVVRGSYKDSFKGIEKFDVVILSHVIEHMPDLIFFFQDIMNVLKKNGKLILIYPDARYCFDHFRNGSTFVDAYDVYRDNKHSASRVFDFVNNVVNENNAAFFWNNPSQNDILPKNNFKETLKAYDKALKNELPEDVHFWPFSDFQFVKFLYDLDRAGLLDLDIEKVYATQENTQEFMIILKPRKIKKLATDKYIDIMNTLSTSTRQNQLTNEVELLNNQVIQLNEKINNIKDELAGVYGSKRWVYASKLAALLHRLEAIYGKKV